VVVDEMAVMASCWAARLAAVSSGVVCEEDADKVGMRVLVMLLLLDDMLDFSWRTVGSDIYV
jgi:hypothetical protein